MLKFKIEMAKQTHLEDAIIPHVMSSLGEMPQTLIKTLTPQICLSVIISKLDNYYLDVTNFATSMRIAGNLKKGSSEDVSAFSVRLLTSMTKFKSKWDTTPEAKT